MKKIFLSLIAGATLTFGATAQNVHIPDANFKAVLLDHGKGITGKAYGGHFATLIDSNGDNEIQVSEANAYTGSILCLNENIADLTGIEAFTSAKEIDYIDYGSQRISSIDISKNTALESFILAGSHLTNIDLTSNTALTYLEIVQTSISDLDLSNCTSLTTLKCSENELTKLDVSANTGLTYIDCNRNKFAELDFSNNVALEEGYLQFNGNLERVDLKNGANGILTKFNGNHCAKLACIQVDDATAAANNSNWTIAGSTLASYDTNCPERIVYIPDATFKSFLVNNASINKNGDNEIQYSEAENYTQDINVNNKSINDLTGIEAFTSIFGLYCIQNRITSLDLSNNSKLTTLYCNKNRLTELTLNNPVLTEVWCDENNLDSLDVTKCPLLIELKCSENKLSKLSIQNPNLEELLCNSNSLENIVIHHSTSLSILSCQNNLLKELDLSSNPNLTQLALYNNNLQDLNVANGFNTNITYFHAGNNPSLTCIQVDDVAYSTTNWTFIDAGANFSINCAPACVVNIPDSDFKFYLLGNMGINTNGDGEIQCDEASAYMGKIDCSNLSISDLTGIEAFTSLTQLWCFGNNLTSLDITQNIDLIDLRCHSNSISSIDVSNNTALNYFYCGGNMLISLDLSFNVNLIELKCNQNSITNLNVSNNIGLTNLQCYSNSITSLDISNNPALTELNCFGNALTTLDISQNPVLTKLRCQNNALTSLNVANGNNVSITSNEFYASGNPGLTCIQVDDAAYSATNWTNKDAGVSFSNDCGILTSIDHVSTGNISVYPNPASSHLTVENITYNYISIINTRGEEVQTVTTNNIDVSELPKGVYILNIHSDTGLVHSRFVKK